MTLLLAFLTIAFLQQPSTAKVSQAAEKPAGYKDAIMDKVRLAMAPALPFPASDGVFPDGNNTEALWMVRELQHRETTIEVIANPLNQANQARAARAMAQIENNIQAAQRRAAEQYDRAVSEA